MLDAESLNTLDYDFVDHFANHVFSRIVSDFFYFMEYFVDEPTVIPKIIFVL